MKFSKDRFGRDVWSTWRKEKYKTEKIKFQIWKTEEKFHLVIYSTERGCFFDSEKDNYMFNTLDEASDYAIKWADEYFDKNKKK